MTEQDQKIIIDMVKYNVSIEKNKSHYIICIDSR